MTFLRRSEKREVVLNEHDHHMGTALLAAQRSRDPACQVGACIVNAKGNIVSVGFNSFPNGCSDDEFPWGKTSINPLETKFFYGMFIILAKEIIEIYILRTF